MPNQPLIKIAFPIIFITFITMETIMTSFIIANALIIAEKIR